jgi:Ca2+-binding EF-hand superfamily protein
LREKERGVVLNIGYSFNSSMEDKKERVTTEQMVESVVDKVFKKYDLNQNNFIDFPEFCKMI